MAHDEETVPLSRESVTEAAIDFLEARGIEKLTMRALASEIGCGTMSLYSHIKNRGDLLDSIVETLAKRAGFPEIAAQTHQSWQEVVTATQLAYRDLALRYPRSFELLALAPFDVAPVVGHLEGLVEALQRAGLSTEWAYEVLGAIDAYGTGFLAVWARTETSQQKSDIETSTSLRRLRTIDVFERGLQTFILGFERAIEQADKPADLLQVRD